MMKPKSAQHKTLACLIASVGAAVLPSLTMAAEPSLPTNLEKRTPMRTLADVYAASDPSLETKSETPAPVPAPNNAMPPGLPPRVQVPTTPPKPKAGAEPPRSPIPAADPPPPKVIPVPREVNEPPASLPVTQSPTVLQPATQVPPAPMSTPEPAPQSPVTPEPTPHQVQQQPVMPALSERRHQVPAPIPAPSPVIEPAAPPVSPQVSEPVEQSTAATDFGGPLPPNELFDTSGLPLPVEDLAQVPPAQPLEEEEDEPSLADSLAVNLVKRMVERGLLTQADAVGLFQVAEAEVAAAKAKRRARRAAQQELAQQTGGVPESEKIRVTYVPEIVKQEMREQIKDEVLKQAKEEHWTDGGDDFEVPQWVSAWKPFGDFRLRYEYVSFPSGNDLTGSFPNFNVINTGIPFDEQGVVGPPQYNADQDRQRIRLRLRLGTDIDLGDNFRVGIRIGTGDTNSPVSGNQSLGLPNQGINGNSGQGGQFSKYAIWLDRAFLRWEPVDSLALTIGRFDNPFFASTAIWSEDIGFDGVVLQAHYEVTDGIDPFLTIGSFPIFNTDLQFATNQSAKFESRDKWLNAAQLGIDWQISKNWHAKVATAYYDFRNVEGVLSSPYAPRNDNDPGDTDHTRPSFAQKGNTYRRLRNIVADATNNNGTINQFQYYGLATPFRVQSVTARVDYNGFEPVQVSLLGEYLRNLAFDSDTLGANGLNNRGAGGQFEGGDTAWYLNLRAGKAAMEKRGDWYAYLGYRHVESDAVVDGFNDQDFGGGGTNMKGYTLGAALALSPRVQMALRWFSASQIAGPQFKSDILQFDVSAKF